VKILADKFGCGVGLENDANAGALAEHRYGAGEGVRDLVFLTMGTGLGAGIIIDGRLYRGTSDLAGEIGHVRLTSGGPVGHNKAGSAEGWASGAGMAQTATQMLQAARGKGRRSALTDALDHEGPVTARDVGQAAASGDAVAKQIVRASGRKLGMALAILVDILNPERIVIGGLAMRLGDLILGPAIDVMRREALSACCVVPALLGEKIGDIASLCVAVDSYLESGAVLEEAGARR
jgi:glucokinase